MRKNLLVPVLVASAAVASCGREDKPQPPQPIEIKIDAPKIETPSEVTFKITDDTRNAAELACDRLFNFCTDQVVNNARRCGDRETRNNEVQCMTERNACINTAQAEADAARAAEAEAARAEAEAARAAADAARAAADAARAAAQATRRAELTACLERSRECVRNSNQAEADCQLACNEQVAERRSNCNDQSQERSDAYRERVNEEQRLCNQTRDNTFQTCIAPHEEDRDQGYNASQREYVECQYRAEVKQTNCYNDCTGNDRSCGPGCHRTYSLDLVECNHHQRNANNSRNQIFNRASNACDTMAEEQMRNCENNIDRGDSQEIELYRNLCHVRAEGAYGDCRRSCEPAECEDCYDGKGAAEPSSPESPPPPAGPPFGDGKGAESDAFNACDLGHATCLVNPDEATITRCDDAANNAFEACARRAANCEEELTRESPTEETSPPEEEPPAPPPLQ